MSMKGIPKDFNEFLNVPLKYFYNIGFDPFNRTQRINSSTLWQGLFYFGIVNLLVLACVQCFLAFGVSAISIIDKSVYIISLLYTCVFFGKIITIFNKRETMTRILHLLEAFYPISSTQQKTFKFSKFYAEILILFRLTKYSSFFSIFTYISTPLLLSFFALITTGKFAYLLPISLWWTFDKDSIILYAIIYFHQSYAIHFCNFGILATDAFLCHLVILTCMFFEYISNSFSTIGTEHDPINFKQIRGLVHYHSMILRISGTINDVFSISVLLSLATASLNLCMMGFQVIDGISLVELVRYALLLCLQLWQIAYVCYLGMRITECSTNVGTAAFHHLCASENIKYRKYLILIIQRSQRPAILNAPLLAVVSLETMRKVISIAFQFFTLLNSIKSKTNK